MTPGWLLDQVASAGRENLDAEHASRYDAEADVGAPGEVGDRLALGATFVLNVHQRKCPDRHFLTENSNVLPKRHLQRGQPVRVRIKSGATPESS